MTPKKLERLLMKFAPLVGAMKSVEGLRLDLGEGFVLQGKSKDALRSKRYRDRRKSRGLDRDSSRDDDTEKRGVDRDDDTVGDTVNARSVPSASRDISFRSKALQVVAKSDRSNAREGLVPVATTPVLIEAPKSRQGPRIESSDYVPTAEHASYASARGLTDAEFEDAVVDLREKCTGTHDLAWFDKQLRVFIDTAAGGRKPDQSARATSEYESPEERERWEARRVRQLAATERRLARDAEKYNKKLAKPARAPSPEQIAELVGKVGRK